MSTERVTETLVKVNDLAFNVLVFPLALWLYGRAMEYGRKLGVLSGY